MPSEQNGVWLIESLAKPTKSMVISFVIILICFGTNMSYQEASIVPMLAYIMSFSYDEISNIAATNRQPPNFVSKIRQTNGFRSGQYLNLAIDKL